MKLVNPTPFEMERMVQLDRRGAEQLIVVLKTTHTIGSDGSLTVAAEQPPLARVDEFRGEPDSSSIMQECEVTPPKPSTDVFLIGSAIAPDGDTTVMGVEVRVGPVTQTARITGDRVWRRLFGIPMKSSPERFDRIPLIHERAYGGEDLTPKRRKRWGGEARNPVGCGFRVRRSRQKLSGQPLPNIERPRKRLRRPCGRSIPVGFGPIGRNWLPRMAYAGTYDQNWVDSRMPLLPADFDGRYYNAAPAALIAPGHLSGGERVDVRGCTASGVLRFQLPSIAPAVRIVLRDREVEAPLVCDTVTIDTDAMELRMLYKASFDVHREALKVEEIELRLGGGAT